jgi:hypothetical protein
VSLDALAEHLRKLTPGPPRLNVRAVAPGLHPPRLVRNREHQRDV